MYTLSLWGACLTRTNSFSHPRLTLELPCLCISRISHTHTHTNAHTHMHAYMHAHIRTRMHTHPHTQTWGTILVITDVDTLVMLIKIHIFIFGTDFSVCSGTHLQQNRYLRPQTRISSKIRSRWHEKKQNFYLTINILLLGFFNAETQKQTNKNK